MIPTLVPEGREIIVRGQPRRVMVPSVSERIGRYARLVLPAQPTTELNQWQWPTVPGWEPVNPPLYYAT